MVFRQDCESSYMNPTYDEMEDVVDKLLRTYTLAEVLEQGNVTDQEALLALFEAGLLEDLPDELLPV